MSPGRRSTPASAKPRELAHDAQLYRAYLQAAERLGDAAATFERVVLDYELKRDYQRFLQEPNRERAATAMAGPIATRDEVREWARGHDLPYDRRPRPVSRRADRIRAARTAAARSRTSRSSRRTTAARTPRRRRRTGFTCYRVGAASVAAAAGGTAAAVRSARRRGAAAMTYDERVSAVAELGFHGAPGRLPGDVMLHSGVCLGRQYCAFAGIVSRPEDARLLQHLVTQRYRDGLPVRARQGAPVPRPLQAAVRRHRRAGQPSPQADASWLGPSSG